VSFSFFNRFISPKKPHKTVSADKNPFHEIAEEMNGTFFTDFKLFHHDAFTPIDLLLFAPQRGLYIGEKIPWFLDDLQGASIERATRRSKKSPSTRFESIQSKIHQKLQDVLFFDSTSCQRFIWMENLKEEEFDSLDPTFHELLPKSNLVFKDETKESILQKLENMAELQTEPYPSVKVIGSLNAHMLLLPTPEAPFGAFLSKEQHDFLSKDFNDTTTILSGGYGSGKSAVLIRKAIIRLLNDPTEKVLILTPTLLAAELLRNEFVSLLEYSALSISLSRITFVTPEHFPELYESKSFMESTSVLCDDSHLLGTAFVDELHRHRGRRWLLLSTIPSSDASDDRVSLHNRYRETPPATVLNCDSEELFTIAIRELKKKILFASPGDIMFVLPDTETLFHLKKSIDENLQISTRALTPEFSLQYEDLDGTLFTTAEMINAISTRHLILVSYDGSEDYTYTLSRASESATIISVTNPHGVNDEENHQE